MATGHKFPLTASRAKIAWPTRVEAVELCRDPSRPERGLAMKNFQPTTLEWTLHPPLPLLTPSCSSKAPPPQACPMAKGSRHTCLTSLLCKRVAADLFRSPSAHSDARAHTRTQTHTHTCEPKKWGDTREGKEWVRVRRRGRVGMVKMKQKVHSSQRAFAVSFTIKLQPHYYDETKLLTALIRFCCAWELYGVKSFDLYENRRIRELYWQSSTFCEQSVFPEASSAEAVICGL